MSHGGTTPVAPVVLTVSVWNKGVKSFRELDSSHKLTPDESCCDCRSQQFFCSSAKPDGLGRIPEGRDFRHSGVVHASRKLPVHHRAKHDTSCTIRYNASSDSGARRRGYLPPRTTPAAHPALHHRPTRAAPHHGQSRAAPHREPSPRVQRRALLFPDRWAATTHQSSVYLGLKQGAHPT
jgi:hypothetical protein